VKRYKPDVSLREKILALGGSRFIVWRVSFSVMFKQQMQSLG
jgi:hypothetical protein